MRESAFEKAVVNNLTAMGAWVQPKTNMSIRGLSDRIVCYRGHFVAVEFKTDRGAKRKTGGIVLQKYTQEEIKKAGGKTFIVYPGNVDEFISKLMELRRV